MTMSPTIATQSIEDRNELHRAFVAEKSAIEAMDDTDGRANGVDIVTASAIVLRALDGVSIYRDIAASAGLPFDTKAFDQLRSTVWAAQFTQNELRSLSKPPEPIADLIERGRKLLDMLVPAASALVSGGLMRAFASELKGSRSYQDLALDLQLLGRLFEQHWMRIEAKTHITRAEWDEAQALGVKLFEELQKRDRQTTERDAMALMRLKAKLLLVERYDEVRRVITFLRWKENDAEEIAPSLFAMRMAGRRKSASDVENDDTLLSPTSPNTPPKANPVVQPLPNPVPTNGNGATDDPFQA